MSLMQFLMNRDITQKKEIILSEEFRDNPFTIRCITNDEWEEMRKKSLIITNKDVRVDQAGLNLSIVAAGCVDPNFKAAENLSAAGITLPSDLIRKLLKPGEIDRLANAILQYSGFTQEEMQDTVKK